MITLEEMRKTAKTYRADKVHIGVIGSHSALALGMAAKAFGAQTLLVVFRVTCAPKPSRSYPSS